MGSSVRRLEAAVGVLCMVSPSVSDRAKMDVDPRNIVTCGHDVVGVQVVTLPPLEWAVAIPICEHHMREMDAANVLKGMDDD